MKKTLLILLAVVLLLGLAACAPSSKAERPLVDGSPAAIFAYVEEEGYKIITSEIAALYTFDSLDLTPAAEEIPFDWVYRIVFNPPELVSGRTEITVLFGAEALSINGKTYVPAGGDTAAMLDWAAGKYHFFDYELHTD